MQSQIDINLYDRQIRTYGEDAVIKMASSSVTIIGLENGLSTEIAKNLTLGGIKNIYLYDNSLIIKENLETGFYYNKDNMNLLNGKYKKEELFGILSEGFECNCDESELTNLETVSHKLTDGFLLSIYESGNNSKFLEINEY